MEMIIGGAYQGKTDHAKKNIHSWSGETEPWYQKKS